MKRIILSILILWAVLPLESWASKDTDQYDICIYGATSSGVIAAHTARKMGKSVVLIATDEHIGGLSSGGLGATDIGNKQVIGGYSRDFYQRLGQIYGEKEIWTFEPKAALKIFNDYLKESDVPIIFNKRIETVEKEGAAIVSVTLVNTFGSSRKKKRIAAKVFLDCTYEGDLMAMAKVSYTVGRENNDLYGETLSGFHLPEYRKKSGFHQFPDGVSPYVVADNPSSGLVWGISDNKATPTGSGDKLVQAYNFRICLTDSVENRIPITKPKGYDVKKYELLARLFEAQPDDKLDRYFIWSRMPKRKTDINNRGAFSTDMIGANHNWAEASFDERKKIFEEHESYTKGLLYFYLTDKRVPAAFSAFIANWGYPKDEYVKNGHFTPQLYIREGRRMVGEYVMTEHNCVGHEVVNDPVGMAAYGMDSHNTQRIVVNGMVKNEGNVEVGGFAPYPVSLRAIVPQKTECTNLIVPVSLSASHIAFGSIRMEPVFMVLGQSAAIVATHAIDEDTSVQAVDYGKLKMELLKQGQILAQPKK